MSDIRDFMASVATLASRANSIIERDDEHSNVVHIVHDTVDDFLEAVVSVESCEDSSYVVSIEYVDFKQENRRVIPMFEVHHLDIDQAHALVQTYLFTLMNTQDTGIALLRAQDALV